MPTTFGTWRCASPRGSHGPRADSPGHRRNADVDEQIAASETERVVRKRALSEDVDLEDIPEVLCFVCVGHRGTAASVSPVLAATPADPAVHVPADVSPHRAVLGRPRSQDLRRRGVRVWVLGSVQRRAHQGSPRLPLRMGWMCPPDVLPLAQFLEKARALGDFLLVGINDDDTVNTEHGSGFPIMNLHERALR